MFKIAIVLSIFLLAPALDSIASDTAIKAVPGNYDIIIKEKSTFKPEGSIKKEKECIKDETYDPEKFFSDAEGCSVSNVKKSGNSLTFDMKCGGQGMPEMSGTGKAKATSNTIFAHYKMGGTFQGMDVFWDVTTEGTRTGPCK